MNKNLSWTAIAAAIVLLIVGLAMYGCVPTQPTDQGGDNTFNLSCIGSDVCNQGNTGNGGTGTNGPANLPEGSTIRVGIFGHDCPAGVATPNNGSGQIRIACRGAGITATPKGPGGVDLDPAVHGTQIEWQVTGGGVTCTGSYLGEAFNQFCTCPAGSAGSTFSLSAKVKNVTGVLNGSCLP